MKRFYKQHKILGNKGEELAIRHYEKAGFSLVSKNFRTRNSELDFVVKKDDELIFVEVKTVEKDGISDILGEDNFSKQKRHHMKKGIEQYLFKEKPYFKRLRIDLACVYYHTQKDIWTIKLYENIILE